MRYSEDICPQDKFNTQIQPAARFNISLRETFFWADLFFL